MNTAIAAVAIVLLGQVPALEQALSGQWHGTLEYRDYRSDRRVTLPTTLIVSPVGPGKLAFAYTYDDGPGKTVKSSETITIDSSHSTYRIQNGDDSYDATFVAAGLEGFGSSAPVIRLLGKGDENGAAVDLRITITVTASALTMMRESRKPGENWMFRNQYRLSR